MNRHNVFIVDEGPLIAAIRKYGKGVSSKDYEYAVSIHMKRKLEANYKEPFCIVFDLKPGIIDPKRNFNPTPEETNRVLREMLQEDTPVDFGLVKGTVDKHEESGFAFQVKKFIGRSKENFNQDLLDYIHKILAKYKPGEASLIVLPDLEKNPSDLAPVNVDFLRKNIVVPKGSFMGVFVMYYDGHPVIRQIYPALPA